jgi:capsid assembly protease
MLMVRPLLASRIFDVPLLIERNAAEAVVSALAGELEVMPPLMAEALPRPQRKAAIYEDQGGVAVVPIVGELAHRAMPMEAMSGVVGYASLQNQLLALADDPRVRGILLDLDTPGGEVGGISELSDAISEISGKMPVWALANSTMASAGYWIGSATDRVIATPYARVGSIGVVMMHVDISKAVAKKGLVTTFVHAGKHKIDGNAFEPLSESALASMVTSVQDVYGQFVEQVAKGRGMDEQAVRDTEAAVYGAKQALEIGLVDDISTLSKTIGGMRSAIETRRRAMFQGMSMKTYEDGITEGKALGFSEGRAEGLKGASDASTKAAQEASLAAGKAERDRISAIMNSDEAKGRETLATYLAFSTDLKPADAEAMLKASPKAAAQEPKPKPAPKNGPNATADSIIEHLRATSPAVAGQDDDGPVTDEEKRREEIRMVAARASGRRPPQLTHQR